MSQISSQTMVSESAGQTIPDGYKQTEVGVIPEDWNISELRSFVQSLDAGISVNSVDQIEAFSHDKHILKTSCVSKGYFYPNEAKSIVPIDVTRAKTTPQNGAIIISRMNTPDLVGELGFVDGCYTNLFLPDRLWQMQFRSNLKINTRWLAYVLSFKPIAKKIKESSTGTSNSMKNISKGSLLSITFPVPNFKEQTAIANALSDVDALLNEVEKLITKKQAIKTATMQQLLTGKTRLPQFAFHPEVADITAQHNQALSEDSATVIATDSKSKTNTSASASTSTSTSIKNSNNSTLAANNKSLESRRKGTKQSELGEIPEDWEVLRIEDCTIKIGSGKTPSGGSSVYVDTGRPFVRSQNVGVGKLRLTDLAFITEEIHATFSGSEIMLNDVLLNITGASIGRCSLASTAISGGNVNQHVCIIRSKLSKVKPYLLQALINSDTGQQQIDSYQAGGNREGLNFSQVRNMKFAFSNHLNEQTAIATVLSDMDEEIQALQQRLNKTRQIKQGMMQELLTGKTRLPFEKVSTSEASV
jgi:type I restriction enzyme, S subunit